MFSAMNRYLVRVLEPDGTEFSHYAVHADTQGEALQQAHIAFFVLYRDKEITNYKLNVTFDRAMGRL